MTATTPTLTGGCQCGAVRYVLTAAPRSSVCHCRMCQKAVGGPFAALAKVPNAAFAWTRGQPASFRSSTVAERHFCPACGTPLTFRFLDGDGIEVTTASLDDPSPWPPILAFGTESRLPWTDRLAGDTLPHAVPSQPASGPRRIVSRQHPDHDTPATWRPPA